jgi:hypothetical protein
MLVIVVMDAWPSLLQTYAPAALLLLMFNRVIGQGSQGYASGVM